MYQGPASERYIQTGTQQIPRERHLFETCRIKIQFSVSLGSFSALVVSDKNMCKGLLEAQ